MRLFKFVVVYSLIVFSISSLGGEIRKLDTTYAAESAASFINRYKTVGELLDSLKGFYTVEELSGTRAIFQKNGIKLSDKIPSAKSMGNSIMVGGIRIMFEADRAISMKGITYRPNEKKLDDILKEVADQEKKGHVGHFSFFPEANAFVGPGMFAGIGTAIGTVAAAAVVAGVAVAYVGSEIIERVKDGNLECAGGVFKIRKRTRNIVGYATHDDLVINLKAASEILKKDVKQCDDDTKTALRDKIRNMDYEEVKKSESVR